MTNYQTALNRINHASTIKELESLEKSFDRIHQGGFLTDSELTRLDLKLCDKKDLINAFEGETVLGSTRFFDIAESQGYDLS